MKMVKYPNNFVKLHKITLGSFVKFVLKFRSVVEKQIPKLYRQIN